jgi:DNA helicase II / ATP-dependent DNA helicase PcrA
MALTTAAGLAEERRLFYVAVTRARDELNLYSPLRMPHHRRGHDDRHRLAPASRFLDGDALRTLEVQELIPVRNEVSAIDAPPVSVDISSLWH